MNHLTNNRHKILIHNNNQYNNYDVVDQLLITFVRNRMRREEMQEAARAVAVIEKGKKKDL